jgi:hypothetical protein
MVVFAYEIYVKDSTWRHFHHRFRQMFIDVFVHKYAVMRKETIISMVLYGLWSPLALTKFKCNGMCIAGK